MNIKGVITGDIIQSTNIKSDQRQLLLTALRQVAQDLERVSPIRMELFRGDSFQVIADDPAEALRLAVLIRAGLQSQTSAERKKKWDARMSLGLGEVDYASESVVLSDGEAFHNSGREFDSLGKRNLSVRTPWKEVNDELKVSTAFADEVISKWSTSQAEVIYCSILHTRTQREVAAELGQTVQNVNKLMTAGREWLIREYLERYKQIITNKMR